MAWVTISGRTQYIPIWAPHLTLATQCVGKRCLLSLHHPTYHTNYPPPTHVPIITTITHLYSAFRSGDTDVLNIMCMQIVHQCHIHWCPGLFVQLTVRTLDYSVPVVHVDNPYCGSPVYNIQCSYHIHNKIVKKLHLPLYLTIHNRSPILQVNLDAILFITCDNLCNLGTEVHSTEFRPI